MHRLTRSLRREPGSLTEGRSYRTYPSYAHIIPEASEEYLDIIGAACYDSLGFLDQDYQHYVHDH